MNKFLIILIFILLLGSVNNFAATKTWLGNTTDWNTASNWNPASLPSSSDQIIIPTSPSGGNMPTINSGSYTIKSLTIESGATLTQNNGTLLVKGSQTSISGTYNQTGGTFLTDQTVTVNSGGSLNISCTFHLADNISKDPTDHLLVNGTINQKNGVLNVKNLTINIGGNYTLNGTALDIFGAFNNYANVYLNSGDVTLRSIINNLAGGTITIAGATVTSLGQDVVNKGSMSISSGSLLLKKSDGTSVNKKIKIDGGTFTQTGGTVSVKDFEIINGGSYNQSNGELKVNRDFKCDVGNTFAATGGTVHFTGAAGASNYKGGIQFFNVLIDDGADPKFNTDGNDVTIKIAGNFTNNNAGLSKIDKSTFIFNGTGDQTIYSASNPLPEKATFGNLEIDKPSTIQLLSEVAVKNTFTETNGILDHNGYTMWVNGSPMPV